jgi:hypothetical protein
VPHNAGLPQGGRWRPLLLLLVRRRRRLVRPGGRRLAGAGRAGARLIAAARMRRAAWLWCAPEVHAVARQIGSNIARGLASRAGALEIHPRLLERLQPGA